MRDERVELDKGARIEEQLQALSCSQLAHRMLALDACLSPAEQRFRAGALKPLEPLLVCRQTAPSTVLVQRRSHHRTQDGAGGPQGVAWISTDSVNNRISVWITGCRSTFLLG